MLLFQAQIQKNVSASLDVGDFYPQYKYDTILILIFWLKRLLAAISMSTLWNGTSLC